ncbi:16S rRNA (guanine(527)-N(7))-methyltransferase RsmG [Pelagibacteraceae bacterium]|nr:16S rRNA (guanine(527)-N(7))-methyltransferase RsmG [Pelagibacteraceae bacterium]
MNDKLYSLEILSDKLKFDKNSIEKLHILHDELIKYNLIYNLISKTTIEEIWSRHILDSAQLIKFIDFRINNQTLADLGTGAGFPGLVLAIFNKNPLFHVKLYEKSPVKVKFLNKIIDIAEIKSVEVCEGDFKNYDINSDYIVCRAFKKLDRIIEISREIATKKHKLIVLKGKSAQEEVESSLKKSIFKYKLIDSITDKKSKIIFVDEHI